VFFWFGGGKSQGKARKNRAQAGVILVNKAPGFAGSGENWSRGFMEKMGSGDGSPADGFSGFGTKNERSTKSYPQFVEKILAAKKI
jgi:hypothetical protein